jgi:hypothetical protein
MVRVLSIVIDEPNAGSNLARPRQIGCGAQWNCLPDNAM